MDQEQGTWLGVGIAGGMTFVNLIPKFFNWLAGRLDSDSRTKGDLQKSLIDTLVNTAEQARADAKEALQAVKDCEARHDQTIKAVFEDKISYEKKITRLEAMVEQQQQQLSGLQQHKDVERLIAMGTAEAIKGHPDLMRNLEQT
jgi:hypothetical protein